MKKMFLALLCAIPTMVCYGQIVEKKIDSSKGKVIELNTVMVTGKASTDPVLSKVKTDLVKKVVQPKNVADLFSNINAFTLIKRGNYAIEPSFRASQYEQLNIQFDGGTKAMHACPNRMDPITTHVVPEDIEKIEIIKGPYTMRYGSTFAGIVNLVTQTPQSMQMGLHGSVSSGYESNGGASVSSIKLQQVTDAYDITANAGYRDFGNYKDGAGTVIPSSFRSLDYGLKVGYNISDTQRVQAHWRQSYGRDVLHAGLPMDTEEDNSSILSLDYKINGLKGLIKEVNAKAYYSYVDHIMSNNNRPSFAMTEALSTIDATTAGGKVEFKLKPAEEWTVYSGLDALLVARDGGRSRLVKRNMMGEELAEPLYFQDKVWQDSYINDFGIFTEHKYKFSNNTLLTAGVRLDLVTSDIRDPEEDFRELYPDLKNRTESNFSGTVSVKQKLSEVHTLEVAFGRGTRSANMIERYINHFQVGQDPFEYVGNPYLDAEVNNQFEIGLSGKKSLTRGVDALQYNVSGYYSIYENYIVPVVDPLLDRKFNPTAQPQEVKRFINVDKAFKTGVEADVSIDFMEHYNFYTALAYVYTRNEDLDESLPLTPPLTTRFGVRYEKGNLWSSLDYNLTSQQEEISTSFREQETEGYQTLDFKIGVEPITNVHIGLAVLNLFDETYNNHLNFSFVNQEGFDRVPINDPGRNFSVFAKYLF